MKKLAIINQNSGYLMIDIAHAFSGAGVDVTLIAGRLVQRNIALAANIRFQKIISYNRSSAIKRLFTWGVAALQILFNLWFRFRNHELLIVSNPPFAPLLPLLFKNKFSLLIYDVYPDALTETKVFSAGSPIVKAWFGINQKVYPKAQRIITLSDGMKEVIQKYAGSKEPEVIPIWTDNQFLKPVVRHENSFIREHALADKFNVIYSGNLGQTHPVEMIPELAAAIKDPQIQFIIIGEGDKKEQIQKKIKELNLTNCTMLPYQQTAVLPFSLAAADIAIVTLSKDASQLSIPSKTYNLMSVGATLLCIADSNSELNRLVNKYEIGQCYRDDQLDEMRDFILAIKQNPEKQRFYAENALKASKYFGPENAKRFLD